MLASRLHCYRHNWSWQPNRKNINFNFICTEILIKRVEIISNQIVIMGESSKKYYEWIESALLSRKKEKRRKKKTEFKVDFRECGGRLNVTRAECSSAPATGLTALRSLIVANDPQTLSWRIIRLKIFHLTRIPIRYTRLHWLTLLPQQKIK